LPAALLAVLALSWTASRADSTPLASCPLPLSRDWALPALLDEPPLLDDLALLADLALLDALGFRDFEDRGELARRGAERFLV
jgi:hypothetical protein